MEKRDSAPPSRFPGGTASSTDRLASEPSPSSPNSPTCAAPSLSSGEDHDIPKAPVKFRSLKDIYAELDRRSLRFKIKVPPGYNFDSPKTAKRRGTVRGRGDSLKVIRSKTPPGFDIRSLGAQSSTDSSLGVQETESASPSLHYKKMVDNVLEDYLKQEIVNNDYKASLRAAGIAGPVGSRPRLSGLRQPIRITGRDEGPSSTAPGSASRSSNEPKNARAPLQSQEGRGGPDHNPVAIGGPSGSRSGTGEPSQATSERSSKKPGRWIEKRLQCGTLLRIKLPESGSNKPPDKPDNRESENQ